jgi:colanic acid/amylovoran biosynthesis glycosyltransferase
LCDLGVQPVLLGRSGALGALDRTLFKQFGILPPRPNLKDLAPRLVHAHFGRGGALALPIARRLGLPLVVTYHGGDATKDKHYQRRLIPTIYQRRMEALKRDAAVIICVSDFIRQRLIDRGFPEAKLKVIRYGIEMSLVDDVPEAPPYALFVGRFVEKKGIAYLLDAMRLLRAEGNALELVLIGDGPLEAELKAAAAEIGGIRFLGWQDQAAVRRWMRGAVALCVPSVTAKAGDSEGLPNVLLEAMAEAAPVIGARNAGIGEAVEDGVTGLMVPPGEAPPIAAALAAIAGDPALRQRMGQAAQARAASQFSAAAQSRLLEQTMLALLPGQGG